MDFTGLGIQGESSVERLKRCKLVVPNDHDYPLATDDRGHADLSRVFAR